MADEATNDYNEALDLVDVDAASVYADVVTRLEQEVCEPIYP